MITDVSIKAKERFCKDCNIPIKIFKEPYFTERLKLYDRFYSTLSKWDLFVKELKKYHSEQDYFEEYNRVKETVILNIKNSEGYQRFNQEDMNKFRINNTDLPNKDIFKQSNAGKTFISIDIKKANFSSLQYYDSTIFASAPTWEDFIGLYTNNTHIIYSKYIRQVILGNCNPKRHITYERYLMDRILTSIVGGYISKEKVVFFSNDEIIFDVTDMDLDECSSLVLELSLSEKNLVPVKVELFTLHKIHNLDGFCKMVYCESGIKLEFKCINNYMLPFVLRRILGEEIKESDKVFCREGMLSKFIEVPEIGVNLFECKN